MSRKLYLSFSKSIGHRLFENHVQYVNRIQCGGWLRLFRANNFELLDESSKHIGIAGLRLIDRYAQLPKKDL